MTARKTAVGKVPTRISLKRKLGDSGTNVRAFFHELEPLLDKGFSLEICLAYCFLKLEQGMTRTLYGGVAKRHKGDVDIARIIVEKTTLTRTNFKTLYKDVYGKELAKVIQKKITAAEGTRDRVMHGKDVADKEIREAIADVLDYAKSLDVEVDKIAGFSPFGSMTGFKGRATGVDKETTRWLMKGLGFAAS